MDIEDGCLYKIGVNIPEMFLEKIMNSVNAVMEPVYHGYDRTFYYFPVKGTWRPLDGSRPYKGTVGKIETADEVRLEFVVIGKDLKKVLTAIKKLHPYEEPAIDIVPTLRWKDLV